MIDNRRQKYKENRLKGMSPYNAARAAGYSRSLSSTTVAAVKEDIKDAFEQAGLTDKKIIEHALKGLNSKNENISYKYFLTILELTDRLKDQINIDESKYQTNFILSAEELKKARLRADAEYIPNRV